MATNDTAALVVALSAQLTKFEKDMDQAAGIADRGAKKIEDRFSKIDPGAALGEFSSKLEGLLTAGGVFAFITSIHELVSEVAKIGDQAERVGLTAEQFQQLRFAAVSTGASVESAGSFMDRFSRSVSEAGRGAGELYKTFLLNNVAIKDNNGNLLPANVLLGKFADLVKNAKNAQDQMNLSVLAGGRQAGPEFVAVLKEGEEGLRRYADQADKSGAIASEALIKRAKEIETSYNQLWLRLKTGAQEFAVSAATSIEQTGKKMAADSAASATSIKSTWQSIVDYIAEHTPSGLSFLSEDQKKMLQLAAGARAGGALAGNRETAENILRSGGGTPLTGDVRGFPGQGAAPAAGGDGSTKLFNEQAEAFKKLLALEDQRIKLLGAERDAVGLTAGAAEELKTKVNLETAAKRDNIPLTQERLEAIAEEARKVGVAAQAVDEYKRQWSNFNNGLQFIGNNAIDILDGLRTKTLTGAQAVQQLTNSLIKAAEQALLLGSGPLAGLFGTQSSVPGGTGGLFGAIGNALPKFASGTDSAPGGLAWVGERGKELLNLPRGSQVIPNDVASKGFGSGLSVTIVHSPTFAPGMTGTDIAAVRSEIHQSNMQLAANVPNLVRQALRNDRDALTR